MKYNISMSISANADFFRICENLKEYGQAQIDILSKSLDKFVDNVTVMPSMYPQYRNTKYRKAALAYDYIAFYKIDKKNKTIILSRILHSKQNIEGLI